VVLIVVAYLETGFGFSRGKLTTSLASTVATTTIPGNVFNVTTTIGYVYPCNSFTLELPTSNSVSVGNCNVASNSILGLWVASGNSSREFVTIKGADNKTYVNQSSSYSCITLYKNFTAPAQDYTISLRTASSSGNRCGSAIAKLNSTTVLPSTVHNIVYNGDFNSGQYTGWTRAGAGWGETPLNLSAANAEGCYLNKTWSNYNGTFFATTYTCGLSVAPGNLTSSQFYVNASAPFLNFRIISPYNNGMYVEILQNSTPRIAVHYDTFNISQGIYAVSTFANASIPLSTLVNRVVQVRVVSTLINQHQNFIAIGDFALSNKPVQQPGIVTNITFMNG